MISLPLCSFFRIKSGKAVKYAVWGQVDLQIPGVSASLLAGKDIDFQLGMDPKFGFRIVKRHSCLSRLDAAQQIYRISLPSAAAAVPSSSGEEEGKEKKKKAEEGTMSLEQIFQYRLDTPNTAALPVSGSLRFSVSASGAPVAPEEKQKKKNQKELLLDWSVNGEHLPPGARLRNLRMFLDLTRMDPEAVIQEPMQEGEALLLRADGGRLLLAMDPSSESSQVATGERRRGRIRARLQTPVGQEETGMATVPVRVSWEAPSSMSGMSGLRLQPVDGQNVSAVSLHRTASGVYSIESSD